ncbi:hypothetical protein CLPUN_15800 [Clostridium puniceum]|uniref:Uncharacterized protein n=1 Tax=Clostridium puniceum TaxID=29367 RepID=A0A1S8TPW8_9CLOT|nr:hypothetical protein CLPUN_15800 [Clostridium puniceum]
MKRYKEQREFLKSNFNEFKNIKTDKMNGMPQPEIVKSHNSSCQVIELPKVSEDFVKKQNIYGV